MTDPSCEHGQLQCEICELKDAMARLIEVSAEYHQKFHDIPTRAKYIAALRECKMLINHGDIYMKTFRFEGYSDDTFGEYAQTNDDYDNCASGDPIQYELKTPDGKGIVVTGLYNTTFHKGDGWMIGVNTIDEGKPIDDWVLTIRPSHKGYRNQLTVVAPDNAELRCLTREA